MVEEVQSVVLVTDELESQKEPHPYASFDLSANQVSTEGNNT